MELHHALLMVAATAAISAAPCAWSASPWALACGDGRVDQVLDDFDSTWEPCCTADPSIPMPTQRTVAGCSGNALELGFDLRNRAPGNGQSWVVVQRLFATPRDLRGYTHVRLALKGSNIDNHDNVQVKLNAANGLFTAQLVSVTDLPQWRAVYIDLREFTGDNNDNDTANDTADLSSVRGLELAVRRAEHDEVGSDPHRATLSFDEFAVVDLKPGGAHREVQAAFEQVTPVPAVRQAAAGALLEQVVPSGPGAGLVPAWFTEPSPNFNIYAQAEALLVFVHEHLLTGQTAYRDAARALGARLIALQIPPGSAQSGAWFTGHSVQSGALAPPRRATENKPCDGNERDTLDLDSCQWIGNTGWALVALAKLQRSGLYDDEAALAAAIERGASWILAQIGRTPGYNDIASLGIEGNLSAFFGLLAAGRGSDAERLGRGIFARGWDPVQRRMKPGALTENAATALDVAGSWGVWFLRAIGRTAEALESAGYAYSVLRANSFDQTRRGFGDIAGPFTPAVEFTAQAAAAGIRDANLVMEEVAAMQLTGGDYAGAFPGAADPWYGGTLPPWNTTMPGVSPTAWVYFAHSSDPLAELMPTRADLIVDFGRAYGIWMWFNDSTWAQLHWVNSRHLGTADIDGSGQDDVVVDFGTPYGIWAWMNNGNWVPIHALSASALAAGDLDGNGKSDLITDFGATYGIWAWMNNAGWVPIHAVTGQRTVTADLDGNGKSDLIIDFGAPYGIWAWMNNANWVSIHTVSASALAAGDLDGNGKADLITDFGAPYGIWAWMNNAGWVPIHTIAGQRLATADLDGNGKADLIVDFGVQYGIWLWMNNWNWTLLHPVTSSHITVADVDGNRQDDLAVDFGSQYGIWLRKNNASWTNLHGVNSSRMSAGQVDGN